MGSEVEIVKRVGGSTQRDSLVQHACHSTDRNRGMVRRPGAYCVSSFPWRDSVPRTTAQWGRVVETTEELVP
jgi:hypothetical protein